ncbi:MAG: hypothetical protein IKX20_09700 [Paludibacteraceae bacterium]|nr:hypothetical protein [Paludibacteraceae bacterium]
MSENYNIQDRIDEYIRGTMSEHDRAIFESELQLNPDLQKEVRVQSSIADAVQAISLKRHLQDLEAAHQKKQRTRRISFRLMSAAAAGIVLFFVGNGILQDNYCRQAGRVAYADLVPEATRSSNPVDSLLQMSYTMLGNGSFAEAESLLIQASSIAETALNAPIVDEASEYEHRLMQEKKYEVDWYTAISIMSQGHVRKAKRALTKIADSGSPYARNAEEILRSKFYKSIKQ